MLLDAGVVTGAREGAGATLGFSGSTGWLAHPYSNARARAVSKAFFMAISFRVLNKTRESFPSCSPDLQPQRSFRRGLLVAQERAPGRLADIGRLDAQPLLEAAVAGYRGEHAAVVDVGCVQNHPPAGRKSRRLIALAVR